MDIPKSITDNSLEKNPKNILIIEDDITIREQLQTLLHGYGYTVSAIEEFFNVSEQVKTQKPNLILLDIRLPYENGFTLCSKIRAFTNIPIIFVTSSNTDMDQLHSIMLGGDCFITKPYNTPILLAKIASLLKRAYPIEQVENLCYQGAILHLECSSIEYNKKQVELTKNELKILYYLFKHSKSICQRSDIMDFLWDNQLYIDDNALSVNINRIREKLSNIGLTNFIKTKHGQGYTL